MTLRVDLTRCDRDSYLETLRAAGIAARPVEWVPTAVRLDTPIAIVELPGFKEGRVSVQDAGAQLAAPLLAAQPGMRVLDACAAPGGKTGHLLEHTPELTGLVAVDIETQRVGRIEENLRRLGREARLVVADLRNCELADGPFDRILLDAPCSATGVIRRHPDIKLLRRTDDIAALASAQLEILRAAFGMLAAGGRLLYSTCSVLPDENEAVVERFLALEPAARTVPLTIELPPESRTRPAGVQLLPGGRAGTDGFYYSCLEKTTAGT